MTRLAVGFDRLAALLLGVGLAAAGAALIWARLRVTPVATPSLQWLTDVVDQPWWPWVSAGGGALLLAIGLRWLAAHHRSPKAARIGLTNTALPGSLTADPSAVADAAAEAMRAQPSVLKASARAAMERGVTTVTLTATTPAQQGLSEIVAAADEVATTAALMMGDAVAVRTRIHVDAKRRRVMD
jgi:hypothetical protein